jgi:hypothetical protein
VIRGLLAWLLLVWLDTKMSHSKIDGKLHGSSTWLRSPLHITPTTLWLGTLALPIASNPSTMWTMFDSRSYRINLHLISCVMPY